MRRSRSEPVPPDLAPIDAPVDDRSQVQRHHRRTSSSVRPIPDADGLSREARIADKLTRARRALASLDQRDRRATLLLLAIMRRDEVLIDGILADLATSTRSDAPPAPGRVDSPAARPPASRR